MSQGLGYSAPRQHNDICASPINTHVIRLFAGNSSAEVDRLLRSADASIAADRHQQRQHQLGADRDHLESALRCYNQALDAYADDSPFRAAIIRKIKAIQAPGANNHLTSSFASPSHRAHDLDRAADECVRTGDYAGALERRTELYDDIAERRVQPLYGDLLHANELARVLLLLWLELPPARQSPSHVKLLAQVAAAAEGAADTDCGIPLLPPAMRWALGELVRVAMGGGGGCGGVADDVERAVDRMLAFDSLRPEHRLVLQLLPKRVRA